MNAIRNRIADQVWAAYSNLNTAFRQRQAAIALLESASQSYSAALESYNYGVRNLLDVTAAQRTLAQARRRTFGANAVLAAYLGDLAFRTGDSIRREHNEAPSMNAYRHTDISARNGFASALLFVRDADGLLAFDILGSFFPAWLICFALAVFLTVPSRTLLHRFVEIAWPVLVYPSLTALSCLRIMARSVPLNEATPLP